jgi:acyl-CoA synthetase (NDP forming)
VVSTPAEMIDLAAALLGHPRRSQGRRVAVLGDGGGHGAVASDVAPATPGAAGALGFALGGDRLLRPSTAAT